jgi:hypothetical protein
MPTDPDVPESGQLPGRYEWIDEPSRGGVPSDPEWNIPSDNIRTFEADVGASLARQDGLSEYDPIDHNRGQEAPSLSVAYDLQQFPVDSGGSPVDVSDYIIGRDKYGRVFDSILWVGRREFPGGNDDSGVREYTVARGCVGSSVTMTLDPTSEDPILAETEWQPARVRSYRFHQPSSDTTIDFVSTDANDTMDVTVEDEGAGTAETISLNGTNTVTTNNLYGDIDAIWLASEPVGDISVTDGSGTVLAESTGSKASSAVIAGGNTYSDDDQPVDGDRGVPPLGGGAHASALGKTYQHFLGDRFERPSGTAARPRVNSASWTVENDIETSALQTSRAPAIDEANRTVTIEADIAGEYASHDSMMEALQLGQHNLEHDYSGGTVSFQAAVPTDSATRTIDTGNAAASFSETLECSGTPALTLNKP